MRPNTVQLLFLLVVSVVFLGCGSTIMLTSDPSETLVLSSEGRPDSLTIVGSTPMQLYWEPPTSESILYVKLRRPGFVDSKMIQVHAANIPPELHVRLERFSDSANADSQRPMSPTGVAYIKLTSSEAYVDIYINNDLVGQIPKDEPFVKKLTAGSYMVTVRKEFFKPVSIKFNLYDNDVFTYHFDLQRVTGWSEEPPGRLDVVQARGNLSVVTEQSNFKVVFEGQEKVPPFQLRDLPAGKYFLKVTRLGITKTVIAIVNDKETSLLDLDKEFFKQ